MKTFLLKGLLLAGIAAAAVPALNSCCKDKVTPVVKHKVEFSPVKPSQVIEPSPVNDKRYFVTATLDGKEINSGDEVEEGKEIVFTAYIGAASMMRLDKWEVSGADAPDGAPGSITIKLKGPLKVTAVFRKTISIP